MKKRKKMEITKKRLEAFFKWLKNDGLPPTKSERLWRKTIAAKLLNNDQMTLDNYQDFLKDCKQKLESKKSDTVPIIDPKVMIGIPLKSNQALKIIQNAVDADSYIHLFFDDSTDTLMHKKSCQKILESQP